LYSTLPKRTVSRPGFPSTTHVVIPPPPKNFQIGKDVCQLVSIVEDVLVLEEVVVENQYDQNHLFRRPMDVGIV
jgi:hypothetical protein